jgi:hypothetical protein
MPGKKYITILMDYDNMNYAGSNGGSSNNDGISDILTQGLQFQKYIKKISGNQSEPVIEQFSFMSDSEKVEKLEQLSKLKDEYIELVRDFEQAGNALRTGYSTYLSAFPDPNYTNKHVTFAGQNGYVTKRGVFKSYDGSGNQFDGVNGCPPTSGRLIVAGTTLSTILADKKLKQGAAMQDGQICGDEGTNVVVTDFGMPGITYSGCYQSSDTVFNGMAMQPGGPIYNVVSCKKRAVDTGAAVFALRNVDASLNKADCYTGATFVSPTLLGNAYVGETLWSSANTPALSGAFATPYYMKLANGGFISILDGTPANPQLVKQIPGTGEQSCNIIPVVTKFYVTPPTTTPPTTPVNLFTGSSSTLNPSSAPSFSFKISDITPNVTSQNYTVVYTCNGVEKTMNVTGGVPDTRIIIPACAPVSSATVNCSDYHLILTNDGKMQVNKGLNPVSTTATALFTQSFSDKITNSVVNPSYSIEKRKTGSNYISSSAQLLKDEYITSDNGKLVLIMQADGHLVLKTFTQQFKCSTRTVNGKPYDFGGSGSYALYNFTSPIDNSNIGKLAYIDEDGLSYVYPSSMISREQSNYKSFNNFNSAGNDLKVINNSSNNACKLECNNLASSGGYVYDNNTRTCFIKNNNFNLTTPKTYADKFNLNVKRPVPIVPISCNDTLTEIDSTRWSKYKKGGNMTSSFNCGAAKYYSREQQNVRVTEEELYNMAIDIVNKMNYLQLQGVTLSADMAAFKTQLQQTINAYNTRPGVDNVINSALSGMMSDVDLMVLQENSRYLFLSIFAVGVMVVALNAIKK